MLDVIADFWKPVKKTQPQEKLQPGDLQLGSTIGFGFVPQAMLSGRRLHVTAINTYQFGEEKLTSFMLSQEKEAPVSMIVAESDGEQYLAISRLVPLADRMKLFDSTELENVLRRPDVTRLPCKDGTGDFRGWLVNSYKREIQGLRGRIYKGDFRKSPMPPERDGQEFEYTLLVSDSNEHAIEIERYQDGRLEIYTTIYRRLNDIGEITHPINEISRPDMKMASDDVVPLLAVPTEGVTISATPKTEEAKPAEAIPQAADNDEDFTLSDSPPEQPAAPVSDVAAPQAPKAAEPVTAPVKIEAPVIKPAEPVTLQPAKPPVAEPLTAKPSFAPAGAAPVIAKQTPQSITPPITQKPKENAPMANENGMNGAAPSQDINKPKLYVQPTAPENYMKQEVKAVTNGALNNFEADSIECDLRVANKIIDEAIRNEMRLADIVRRIIELPVAYPESVQIPITLTDEDYALLAIRYGITASDRNSIKRRIIEDLNDFSGARKAA